MTSRDVQATLALEHTLARTLSGAVDQTMATTAILSLLKSYEQTWANSRFFPQRSWSKSHDLEKMRSFELFIQAQPHCVERSNLIGHMTGSACVVNRTLTRVLLTHHRKLGLWLQLGGHADGNPDLTDVAMTEAHEESGLTKLHFLPYEVAAFGKGCAVPLPFDLDDHLIPANPKDGEHHHYDVRFLIVADDDERHTVSEESHDVRWFSLDDARRITPEVSMHRQFDKIEALRAIL